MFQMALNAVDERFIVRRRIINPAESHTLVPECLLDLTAATGFASAIGSHEAFRLFALKWR